MWKKNPQYPIVGMWEYHMREQLVPKYKWLLLRENYCETNHILLSFLINFLYKYNQPEFINRIEN